MTAVRKMVPICILWCLWQERNNQTFKDKERSFEKLISIFLRTSFLWAIAIDLNALGFYDALVYLLIDLLASFTP